LCCPKTISSSFSPGELGRTVEEGGLKWALEEAEAEAEADAEECTSEPCVIGVYGAEARSSIRIDPDIENLPLLPWGWRLVIG
jgi:hypothetical protein